jgi:hypothetical protein
MKRRHTGSRLHRTADLHPLIRADPEHFGSTRDRPKTVRYRASTGVHRCDVSSVLNRRVAALWSVGSAGNMRLLAWLNARTR